MAYLHITTVDGNPIIMETSTQAVPGQINISKASWDDAEVASGQLRKFWNQVKEKVEEKKAPAKEEESPETSKKTAAIIQELDALADEIQPQDPVVAYALDKISDHLEGKKQ